MRSHHSYNNLLKQSPWLFAWLLQYPRNVKFVHSTLRPETFRQYVRGAGQILYNHPSILPSLNPLTIRVQNFLALWPFVSLEIDESTLSIIHTDKLKPQTRLPWPFDYSGVNSPVQPRPEPLRPVGDLFPVNSERVMLTQEHVYDMSGYVEPKFDMSQAKDGFFVKPNPIPSIGMVPALRERRFDLTAVDTSLPPSAPSLLPTLPKENSPPKPCLDLANLAESLGVTQDSISIAPNPEPTQDDIIFAILEAKIKSLPPNFDAFEFQHPISPSLQERIETTWPHVAVMQTKPFPTIS